MRSASPVSSQTGPVVGTQLRTEPARPVGASRRRGVLRRPLVAGTVLVLAYLALSLANHPEAYLVSDVGGRVATVRAADRNGGLDVDLGYWAEAFDPDGTLHPIENAAKVGGTWVTAGTLPTVLAGVPLWRVAGYRGLLLLPMAGSVLAAFAARRLADRLRPGEGWLAFWVVGLASPVALYALDFWDHSLGLGLLAWGFVLAFEVAREGPGWGRVALSGLLLGAAGVLRTEALVYGAVIVFALVVGTLARDRRLARAAAVGAVVASCAALPLVANDALERAVLGDSLRAGRTTAYAEEAGDAGLSRRVEVATITGLGLHGTPGASQMLGAGLLVLVVLVAGWAGTAEDRLARLAAVGVVGLYLLRIVLDLGFLPGLVAATPLAGVGLARGWSTPDRRFVALVALVALPLVWAVQPTEGVAPVWGARYLLLSGLLLGVLGVVALRELPSWARLGGIVLAAAVTASGLVWMSVRTHQVAAAVEALDRRPEPVLVSRIGQLFTEAGGVYDGQRWLLATSAGELREALAVVDAAGEEEIAVVSLSGGEAPAVAGFCPVGTDRLRLVLDVRLDVTTYRATAGSCGSAVVHDG